MSGISEKLRRLAETSPHIVTDPLDDAAIRAADVIDALVSALLCAQYEIDRIGDAGGYHASDLVEAKINAALAKAKGEA